MAIVINYWNWSDEQADAEFQRVLAAHDATNCPHCSKPIDRGDVAWNDASTDAGTGYSVLTVQCQRCFHEIAYFRSWHGSIHDFNEFVHVLGEDWKAR